MEKPRQNISYTIVGSIVAFLFQVILAPNIAIQNVVPNFLLVFVILNALSSTKTRSTLTGFILGLLYDFLSVSALGTMSLVLSIIGYTVNSLNRDEFESGWISQAFVLLVAAFFAELTHSVFLSILGFDDNFVMSLWMRVLPGSIYDALFGLITLFIMSRTSAGKLRKRGAMKGRFG